MLAQGLRLTEAEESALVPQFLVDADGTIKYEDFLRFFSDVINDPLTRVSSPASSLGASYTGSATLSVSLESSRNMALEADVRRKLQALRTGPTMQRQFERFDRDRSGFISAAEFIQMLDKLGVGTTRPEAQWLARHLDKDGDGRVSYAEFRSFIEDGGVELDAERALNKLREFVQRSPQVDLRRAFSEADRGGSGKLDAASLVAAARTAGVALSPQESRALERRFVSPFGKGVDYKALLFGVLSPVQMRPYVGDGESTVRKPTLRTYPPARPRARAQMECAGPPRPLPTLKCSPSSSASTSQAAALYRVPTFARLPKRAASDCGLGALSLLARISPAQPIAQGARSCDGPL
jgi:Ca2+-binding EF-hand superfamily protein